MPGIQGYPEELLLAMYEDMVRIRCFEDKVAECFSQSLIGGNVHLCTGQEAVAVGACKALAPGDFITSTHRGHGHCIAKGVRTDRAMAEIMGKQAGYCGGKGGSMHMADISLGILGANGIVGAGLSIAAGSALASKIRGGNEVTLSFFGEGASNTGTFHESLNMAAAWKLPVVYLCENNGYGVSVDIKSVTNTQTISIRAKAYDIPGIMVDGGDILAVYEAVRTAADRARAGEGPTLLECRTYRHQGHYQGDTAGYRPDSYLRDAAARDPIPRFRHFLVNRGVPENWLGQIEASMVEEIGAACRFAVNAPCPPVESALEDVYGQDNRRCVAR